MMPFVREGGQVLTLLFVLLAVKVRHRKWSTGTFETPPDILPKTNLLFTRTVGGVDTNIFYEWAKQFTNKTAILMDEGKTLLIIMDGYSKHTFLTEVDASVR